MFVSKSFFLDEENINNNNNKTSSSKKTIEIERLEYDDNPQNTKSKLEQRRKLLNQKIRGQNARFTSQKIIKKNDDHQEISNQQPPSIQELGIKRPSISIINQNTISENELSLDRRTPSSLTRDSIQSIDAEDCPKNNNKEKLIINDINLNNLKEFNKYC